MDNLSGVSVFVQAAETLSFVEAGRVLGISASAVGKSIARTENRLDARLFHRSTRSMTLTAEGRLFLLRCQRILGELAAAEREISDTHSAARQAACQFAVGGRPVESGAGGVRPALPGD